MAGNIYPGFFIPPYNSNKKEWLINNLSKGWLTKNEQNKLDSYNVTRKYVLRNTLAILPEYKYIKNKDVCVSKKDNRCYFDITSELY